MTSPGQSLQQTEAATRRALIEVDEYDVHIDLASSEETFGSLTRIRFTSAGGPTWVDVKPDALHSAVLNGFPLDTDHLDRGRLPLQTAAGTNELVVEATMRFRHDGEGLHRSVDPADGRHYVYGMSFMDAAPSVFACFDQPDLKAPYTFQVRAPRDWVVIGNAPGQQAEPGVWEFDRTPPLSTYFVTLVAGPYHLIRSEHDGIPLGLSARASLARHLDAEAEELLTVTRQCFDEFHRLFGIRYPFGDYHQAFVPEFNAGAMENPGCVTFRDPLVFSSRVTRGVRIQRASTVAHEMAHQWFGNIVTPRWWDDLWLNESFAEYMGNRVTAEATEFTDAWTHNAYSRRQWGLIADQRPSTHPVAGNGAADASAALQDFDGISYTKGSSVLKQLNAVLGDEIFLAGAIDHFTRHRFGNATMHDLFRSWEEAGAGDLSEFTGNWLRTAGADTILLDRAAGVVRRTPPTGHPAERTHALRVASASAGGAWSVAELTVSGPETPYPAGDGTAVVLDAYEDSWALVMPDEETLRQLPGLMAAATDDLLRAGIWNNVRSGFHNARVDPGSAVTLLESTLPSETCDDAVFAVLPWLLQSVAPLCADPAAVVARIHAAAMGKLAQSEPGSTLQLAAFQAAASSAGSPDLLRGWLAGDGRPAGLEFDEDLRWRTLVRLAGLGEVDVPDLQAALDAEPTARAQVEFARARSALPVAEAKQYAWDRFTGRVEASNYELEAAGLGMWQVGQDTVTAPFVERYFTDLPATASVRTGWMLADAAEAFFPRTSLSADTLDRAHALIADPALEVSLRRRLVDEADGLARRLAIRAAYPDAGR